MATKVSNAFLLADVVVVQAMAHPEGHLLDHIRLLLGNR